MAFVNNQSVIAVDYNGVLDTYEGWKGDTFLYPMRPGTKEFLQSLKDLGYRVVIMTAMDRRLVKKWVKDNGLSDLVENVTNGKIPAIMYIDDRAITFNGDFQETFEAVKNFKVYWGGNT